MIDPGDIGAQALGRDPVGEEVDVPAVLCGRMRAAAVGLELQQVALQRVLDVHGGLLR